MAHDKVKLFSKRIRLIFGPLLAAENEAYEWIDGRGWVSVDCEEWGVAKALGA